MIFSARNPCWADVAQTKIALEAIVPWIPGEWINMIVHADYDSAYGRSLFTAAAAGDFGAVSGFVAPPTAIPTSVTRRQFKLALLEIDLLDEVEEIVSTSSDRYLQINWSEAQNFERSNQFVLQMAAALGKTDTETDALFILAGTL
jgi:hypothetical protein